MALDGDGKIDSSNPTESDSTRKLLNIMNNDRLSLVDRDRAQRILVTRCAEHLVSHSLIWTERSL